MASSKLLTFTRYCYGKRSYVYPGDKFRASGGPYYCGTDDQGKRVRVPMVRREHPLVAWRRGHGGEV